MLSGDAIIIVPGQWECVRARTAAASVTTRPASDQSGRYYIAVEPWRAAMGARHDEAEARTRYSAPHAVYMAVDGDGRVRGRLRQAIICARRQQ